MENTSENQQHREKEVRKQKSLHISYFEYIEALSEVETVRKSIWTFIAGGEVFNVPVGLGSVHDDCLLQFRDLDAKCPTPQKNVSAISGNQIAPSDFVKKNYCEHCSYKISPKDKHRTV